MCWLESFCSVLSDIWNMYCDGFIFKWNDKIQKRLLCELTGFDFTQRGLPHDFIYHCMHTMVGQNQKLFINTVVRKNSKPFLKDCIVQSTYLKFWWLAFHQFRISWCHHFTLVLLQTIRQALQGTCRTNYLTKWSYRHADVFASPTCERIAMNKRIFVNLSAPRSIRWFCSEGTPVISLPNEK